MRTRGTKKVRRATLTDRPPRCCQLEPCTANDQAEAAVEALREKAAGKGIDELLREALKLLRQ